MSGSIGNGFSLARRLGGVWFARQFGRAPAGLPILDLYLTNRCNLHCRPCGARFLPPPQSGAAELSTAEWKAVLDSAARLHCSLVSLSGGEPLLRPDLAEIIRHGDSLGMSMHISSNGHLLDEPTVADLRASGLRSIQISLHGPTPAIHDAISGAGSFEKAVHAIALLRRIAPEIPIGVNCTLIPELPHPFAEMVPFVKSLGVRQFKITPAYGNLLHRALPAASRPGLIYDEQKMRDLWPEIERLRRALNEHGLFGSSRAYARLIGGRSPGPRGRYCYAAYALCAVDPYGVAGACLDLPGTISVRERPLEEIWRGPEFARLRNDVRRCRLACWDCTTMEVSLRFRARHLLGDLAQNVRDLRHYVG
ncbi:MAG: radical SAM protein [Myxococcales bacterium]|nr:radical SAM protein [Myxococcales bacterium]